MLSIYLSIYLYVLHLQYDLINRQDKQPKWGIYVCRVQSSTFSVHYKSSSLTKTDLIVEDLGSVFASRLDRNVTYLTDAQFEAVMDILDNH